MLTATASGREAGVRRARTLVLALQAAVVAVGIGLVTLGAPAGPALTQEREIMLGQSGSIVRGQPGEVLALQLGSDPDGGTWVFSRDGSNVVVRPIHVASMPVVCEPQNDDMPVTPGVPGEAAQPQPCEPGVRTSGPVESVLISLTGPGVTTVKGWRVPGGSTATGDLPDTPPDFYYVILVEH